MGRPESRVCDGCRGEAHVEERRTPNPKAAGSNPVTPAIVCGACGKELSVETNDEYCPESLYWHGKHTTMVMNGVCVE